VLGDDIGKPDQESSTRLTISVFFAVNGMNLADVKLRPDATVRDLGSAVAVAALRARKAAFPCAPRLMMFGEELCHRRSLAEVGVDDGAQLIADAYPTVVTASADAVARVWNAETGECEKMLEGHLGPLLAAVFSPDSKLVATASEDRTAKLWQSVNGECWRTLRGHRDVVSGAEFSPDGKLVVTASNDNSSKVWNSKSGKCLATLEGHEQPVILARFNADGSNVITNSQEGKAKIWEPKTGVLLRTVHDSVVSMYPTSFAPDGNTFAVAPGDATAHIYDMDSVRCERVLKGHAGVVVCARFAPAGCELIYPQSPRNQSRSPRSPSPTSSAMSPHSSVCSFGWSRSPTAARDLSVASPTATSATAFVQTASA